MNNSVSLGLAEQFENVGNVLLLVGSSSCLHGQWLDALNKLKAELCSKESAPAYFEIPQKFPILSLTRDCALPCQPALAECAKRAETSLSMAKALASYAQQHNVKQATLAKNIAVRISLQAHHTMDFSVGEAEKLYSRLDKETMQTVRQLKAEHEKVVVEQRAFYSGISKALQQKTALMRSVMESLPELATQRDGKSLKEALSALEEEVMLLESLIKPDVYLRCPMLPVLAERMIRWQEDFQCALLDVMHELSRENKDPDLAMAADQERIKLAELASPKNVEPAFCSLTKFLSQSKPNLESKMDELRVDELSLQHKRVTQQMTALAAKQHYEIESFFQAQRHMAKLRALSCAVNKELRIRSEHCNELATRLSKMERAMHAMIDWDKPLDLEAAVAEENNLTRSWVFRMDEAGSRIVHHLDSVLRQLDFNSRLAIWSLRQSCNRAATETDLAIRQRNQSLDLIVKKVRACCESNFVTMIELTKQINPSAPEECGKVLAYCKDMDAALKELSAQVKDHQDMCMQR